MRVIKFFIGCIDFTAVASLLIGVAGIDGLSKTAIAMIALPLVWASLRMIVSNVINEVRWDLSDYEDL